MELQHNIRHTLHYHPAENISALVESLKSGHYERSSATIFDKIKDFYKDWGHIKR